MEMKQLLDKNVWRPVDVGKLKYEERNSIIVSSMFLKQKGKSDGTFCKLKARLVAGGYMQDRSIYEDISSLTVSWTSVCIILATAA